MSTVVPVELDVDTSTPEPVKLIPVILDLTRTSSS